MRQARHIAMLCALALAVASCGNGSGDDRSSEQTQQTALSTVAPRTDDGLLVGAVASLSGSGADYGTGQVRGIELAVAHAIDSGADLGLEVRDDHSTGDGGIDAIEELIENRASVVLGPTLSPVASYTGPVAQSVGVPTLAVTNTTLDIEEIGDMVWRVSLSEQRMIPQAVEVALEHNDIQTAALVSDRSDGYSLTAARAFRDAAQLHDVELVADVRIDSEALEHESSGDDAELAGYANAVDEAVEAEPDALFLAARSAPAADMLLAARELGVELPMVGGNGFNAPDVLARAGSAAEGLIVAASWNPGIDLPASLAFVEEYSETYGETPDAFAAQAYAGVQIVLAAVEASGSHSRSGIADGLTMLGETDTVLGTIVFEEREAIYPAAVQQVTDGRLELVARGRP